MLPSARPLRADDLMRPDATPTAAGACCIPNSIPQFHSDIPAQCGGNVQRGGFRQSEEVKGQIAYKVRKITRGQSLCVSDFRVAHGGGEREAAWHTAGETGRGELTESISTLPLSAFTRLSLCCSNKHGACIYLEF